MQQNKLYVGSLPYSVTESQIKDLFAPYGEISEVVLIKDKETGRSKGFAFVTFASPESAEKALEQNGKEYEGRALKVNVAKERVERSGGFGGGYRGGGRGGFGGGGNRGRRNDRPRW